MAFTQHELMAAHNIARAHAEQHDAAVAADPLLIVPHVPNPKPDQLPPMEPFGNNPNNRRAAERMVREAGKAEPVEAAPMSQAEAAAADLETAKQFDGAAPAPAKTDEQLVDEDNAKTATLLAAMAAGAPAPPAPPAAPPVPAQAPAWAPKA